MWSGTVARARLRTSSMISAAVTASAPRDAAQSAQRGQPTKHARVEGEIICLMVQIALKGVRARGGRRRRAVAPPQAKVETPADGSCSLHCAVRAEGQARDVFSLKGAWHAELTPADLP